MFRTKTMPHEEWASFQNAFEELFTSVFAGDKRTALFIETGNFGEPCALLIPSFKSDLIEALAPGGWEDCSNPYGRKWVLLVGNADAVEGFGLK